MVATTETAWLPRHPSALGPAMAGRVLVPCSLRASPSCRCSGRCWRCSRRCRCVQLAARGRLVLLAWGWVAVVLAGAALFWQSAWLAACCSPTCWSPCGRPWRWSSGCGSRGRRAVGLPASLRGALLRRGALCGDVLLPSIRLPALARQLQPRSTRRAQTFGSLGGRPRDGRAGGAGVQLSAYLAPSLAALYVLSRRAVAAPPTPAAWVCRAAADPFALYASEEWLPVAFALGGLGWVFLPPLGKWLGVEPVCHRARLVFHTRPGYHPLLPRRRLSANRWVRVGGRVARVADAGGARALRARAEPIRSFG